LRLASASRRSATRLRLLRFAGLALRPTVAPRAGSPRRVLLLRPDHIGDVLLTAPAVTLLRTSLPEARLTYLIGPWSADAARRGPPVDEVRILAFPGFTRRSQANLLAPYALLLREAARLRLARYDLAIAFKPDHWWGALLALVAGIPLRVGGATPETLPLLTHAYAPPADQPAAEQALGLARVALSAIAAQPAPLDDVRPFSVSVAARAEADALWRTNGLGGQHVVAIQPAAGAPLKSWPIENWARLADSLSHQNLTVLIVGAPGDGPLVSAIGQRMTTRPLVAYGQSLDVSAALYQRSALVVTVDSGAGHLAASVGTPTVRLYGPAPVSVYGPWPPSPRQHVLQARQLRCVPCGDLEAPPCGARAQPACMLAITVEDVMNTVKAELNQM
jgi:heptosyltransferase III